LKSAPIFFNPISDARRFSARKMLDLRAISFRFAKTAARGYDLRGSWGARLRSGFAYYSGSLMIDVR